MGKNHILLEISCGIASDPCLSCFFLKECPFLSISEYTWIVIDFLMRLHASEEIAFDVIISPTDIEVKVEYWVSLHPPFMFFCDMFDYCILSFLVTECVQLTLMIILCFFVVNWFLYVALRMLSVKVPSNESSSLFIQKKVDNLNI